MFDANDMVLVNQDRVAIVSQNTDLPEDEDIQLTYYTPSGDSLETTIIRRAGVQRPTDMVLMGNNKIAITGMVNCCSYPDSIGPANTFIYLEEEFTAVDPLIASEESLLMPNPASDFVNIVLNNMVIENKNNLKLSFHSMSGSHFTEINIKDVNQQISVRHLIPGIYIAVLRSENEVLLRSKLIKL